MNTRSKHEIILIGGSAGSLQVIIQLIDLLANDFNLPIVIVIHRQRNVLSEFTRILNSTFKNKEITEPDDKDPVKPSCIYIAPQNYHLLFESDYTFSLDYSELIKFSRPSIDVTFENAAAVYQGGVTAVLLSGANNDGSAGLKSIISNGGTAIVQNPVTAEFAAMPAAAINAVAGVMVLSPAEIAGYLNKISVV